MVEVASYLHRHSQCSSTSRFTAGAACWWGVDLGNIENNTARSGERAEAHSARVSAFLPETWAADDSSQSSGSFFTFVAKEKPGRSGASRAQSASKIGGATVPAVRSTRGGGTGSDHEDGPDVCKVQPVPGCRLLLSRYSVRLRIKLRD